MRINFKHLFDWSVQSVSEPYLVRVYENTIPVYAVDVKYVYHGKRKRVFWTDDFRESSSYIVACQYVKLKKEQIANGKTRK